MNLQTFLVYFLVLQNVQKLGYSRGRAIAQAVSRRLPTAATRIRAQVRSCGICGGQSGTGAGFLRVLRFPLPILIPPTGAIGQTVTDVGSGLSLNPPQETYKKLGFPGDRRVLEFRLN
jgi:hypothetical protein